MNTENSKTNEPHKFVLSLDYKDWTWITQKNMLLFKTYLFITLEKKRDSSTKTKNLK